MKKSELIAELKKIDGDPDVEVSIVYRGDDGDISDTADLDMIDHDAGWITLNGRIG